jgi:histone H3/H4
MSATSNPNEATKAIDKNNKKRNKKEEKGYATYLQKVMKQIFPKEKGITISAKAMEVVNAMVEDLEDRVSSKAFDLAKFQKKSTLAAPHVQTATKMVFPPDMGGMAIQEGTKCLTRYLSVA